jgi:hypothetical protein
LKQKTSAMAELLFTLYPSPFELRLAPLPLEVFVDLLFLGSFLVLLNLSVNLFVINDIVL